MSLMPFEISVLGVAILLDLVLCEPPNVAHPVAWMGTAVSAIRKRASKQGRLWPFLTGLCLMLVGIGSMVTVGLLLTWLIRGLPMPLALLAEAAALKLTFSIRGLTRAGSAVQSALATDDLPAARQLLSWHLVSRDTSSLSESQVAAATIESLAENTSDSIVAPLLFYVCAGLPGALAYRFINTSDAILGYRDQEREWLGKVPARVDDLANFIPARITAGLMIVSGILMGCNPLRAIAVWWRDRRTTASPNAGHPMSAAAGVLGVELEKVGQYCLGHGLRLPDLTDITRVTRLLGMSTALACVILGGLLFAMNSHP
ncbi:MAG: cobalamin biosynthesis protein [Planctomycetaceae bacterium]|nr:cobalamin biosynthesis protein [Planctomycetaceae bacterium]